MKYNKRYALLVTIFCLFAAALFYFSGCDGGCEDSRTLPIEFDCTDGEDNDRDGRIDCADTADCCFRPECANSPECPETKCDDGIDNDGDGLTDCMDVESCCALPECENDPNCVEAGNCSDGLDNDRDGFVDCNDIVDCCDEPECEDALPCLDIFGFRIVLKNISDDTVVLILPSPPLVPDSQSQTRQSDDTDRAITLRPRQSTVVTLPDVTVGDILTFEVDFRGQLIDSADCEFTGEFIDNRDPEVVWDGRFLTCRFW